MGRVDVELGNHISEFLDSNTIYNKLESGDMSGSVWPMAVSDRVARHNPDLVVVDGLDFEDFWEYSPEDMNDPEVRNWVRRASIRRRAYMPPLLPEILDKEIVMVGGDAAGFSDFVLAEGGSDSLNTLIKFATFSGITLGVGGAIEFLRHFDHRIANNAYKGAHTSIDPLIKPSDDQKPPILSRRKFIGKAIAAGAATTFLSTFGPVAAADISNDRMNFLYRFAQMTDQLGLHNTYRTWVDGRTALMVQKAVEISQVHDASVSVVMGTGHYRNLDQYLENPNLRLKAIEDLTLLLLGIANDVSDTYSGMEPTERMEHLRDMIGKYSLIGVKPDLADMVFPREVATSSSCMSIAMKHVDLAIDIPIPKY